MRALEFHRPGEPLRMVQRDKPQPGKAAPWCAPASMSDIPSFPYCILWGERRIVSVANLTRQDGEAFFRTAARIRIETTVHPYPLSAANQALSDLREGRFAGVAVLVTGRCTAHGDQKTHA